MAKNKIVIVTQLDPGVKTAVGIDSEGAANIKLIASATEIAPIMTLAAFGKGKLFKTTFESIPNIDKTGKKNGTKKAYSG